MGGQPPSDPEVGSVVGPSVVAGSVVDADVDAVVDGDVVIVVDIDVEPGPTSSVSPSASGFGAVHPAASTATQIQPFTLTVSQIEVPPARKSPSGANRAR